MNKVREVERVLKALTNLRRLEIVRYLSQVKEATVGEIAEKIDLSFKSTSKHLAVLYAADIVAKKQRSLEMWYRLSPDRHPLIKTVLSIL